MSLLALTLLVTGVGADHHDLALATYHLAALTDLLDTRLDFHVERTFMVAFYL
jgi:hypothetical protein